MVPRRKRDLALNGGVTQPRTRSRIPMNLHGNKVGPMVVEERVTIFTEQDRIEGTITHVSTIRLSDFMISEGHQTDFIKIKNATITCRKTGEELDKVPFVLVARDRVTLLTTKTATRVTPSTPSAPANAGELVGAGDRS